MSASRSQLTTAINDAITDPLLKQNTAAHMRAILEALNQNLFNAQDDELTINHIQGLAALLGAVPLAPLGVSFTSTPVVSLPVGNDIPVGDAVVDNNGISIDIDGASINVPLAANGKKRQDLIVANYLAVPAIYERVAGNEVVSTQIAALPTLPAARLFVTSFLVTDGAIAPAPPTVTPNNDSGTVKPTFEIQYQSQNQDHNGETLLILRGIQGGALSGAIRNLWDADTNITELQFCNNFIDAGPNTWIPLGGGGIDFTEQDTQSINLTLDVDNNLTADLNYQDSPSINLSVDAGGLKAEVVFGTTSVTSARGNAPGQALIAANEYTDNAILILTQALAVRKFPIQLEGGQAESGLVSLNDLACTITKITYTPADLSSLQYRLNGGSWIAVTNGATIAAAAIANSKIEFKPVYAAAKNSAGIWVYYTQ